MNLNQFPLSMFEVDCDGSACGSPRRLGVHVHGTQTGCPPLALVVYRDGARVEYREVVPA